MVICVIRPRPDLIRLIQSKSCGTKSNFTAESTKFKITVVVFPGIFQDESAWLYASYGHAPDLIRLIESRSCGTKSNFTAESAKFEITVVVFPGISRMSQHGYMCHTARPPLVLEMGQKLCQYTYNLTTLLRRSWSSFTDPGGMEGWVGLVAGFIRK